MIEEGEVQEIPQENISSPTILPESEPIINKNLFITHKALFICLGLLVCLIISAIVSYALGMKQDKTVVMKKVNPTATPTSSPSATPTISISLQPPTPTTDIEIINVNVLGKTSPTPQYVSPTMQPTSAPQQQVSVGVSGTVFSDDNCNGSKDGNEAVIPNVSVTVYYNNPPTYQNVGGLTTDSSGSFSWSKSIGVNDSYPVEVTALSPSGYTSDPKQGDFSIILKASYPHASWQIGQVPNTSHGLCGN